MASGQTTNLGLNQWQAGDQVLREEFNEDNAKIDAALAALQQELEKKGDLRIEIGTYTGTGTYGKSKPCTLTFQRKPWMVLLDYMAANQSSFVPQHYILFRDAPQFPAYNTTNGDNILTWEENSVSWYYDDTDTNGPTYQLNKSKQKYAYLAIVQ